MSTDEILDALIDAQQALDDAEARATEAAAERNRLLARARATGTGPTRLAELTGVNRARIYQILQAHGLTQP